MAKDNSKDSDAPENAQDTVQESLRKELAEKLGVREEKERRQKTKDNRSTAAPSRPSRKGMLWKSRVNRTFSGVKLREITTFCEELALLLDSGLPLVPALKKLAAKNPNYRLARVLRDMVHSIETGSSFTEAAGKHVNVFGTQFLSIFQAGETSGTLVDAIKHVASRGEIMMRRSHKLISILLYPLIVIIAALFVIGFGFSYTMTVFYPMFEEVGAEVPWTMNVLLIIGESFFSVDFWLSTSSYIIAFVVLYLLAITVPPVRLVRDRLLIRLPYFGRLLKQSLVSRFSRVFATMLNAGVPVTESLTAVRDAMKNELVKLTVDRTISNVQEGGRIIPSLQQEKIFPPLSYDMMEVGEETGDLGEIFMRLADIYEEKTNNELEIMGKLLQPAIISILAVVVGFIVIAMFQVYSTLLTNLGVSGMT